LREGDAVQIFDGIGNALDARIREISGKKVWLHELQSGMHESASSLHIVLAQALSSSEKMDWVVQKATELGVAEIQPIQTQRSVAKLAGERATKRTEHWHGVAVSACEQCARNTLPEVHAPQDMQRWLTQIAASSETKFILLPQGATTLHAQPKPQGKVTLLIGAEGGFTPEESSLALRAGFIPIRLGNRVLRTETAAVAGIAALQTLWGDFAA
jgi:16S rRNA (uracil1498-N3)-methyltransferase